MDAAGPLRRGFARARLLYHTLADLGPRTVGEVVLHTARRRRQGISEWAARAPQGPETVPGALTEVALEPHGARLSFTDAELELSFLCDDVVRLTWGPGPALHPYA